MNSQGDEQQVLDGIESQLRTEDPWLIACFQAFNSVTPPIKFANDRPAKAHAAEIVLIAIAFTIFAVLVAVLAWSPGLLE